MNIFSLQCLFGLRVLGVTMATPTEAQLSGVGLQYWIEVRSGGLRLIILALSYHTAGRQRSSEDPAVSVPGLQEPSTSSTSSLQNNIITNARGLSVEMMCCPTNCHTKVPQLGHTVHGRLKKTFLNGETWRNLLFMFRSNCWGFILRNDNCIILWFRWTTILLITIKHKWISTVQSTC